MCWTRTLIAHKFDRVYNVAIIFIIKSKIKNMEKINNMPSFEDAKNEADKIKSLAQKHAHERMRNTTNEEDYQAASETVFRMDEADAYEEMKNKVGKEAYETFAYVDMELRHRYAKEAEKFFWPTGPVNHEDFNWEAKTQEFLKKFENEILTDSRIMEVFRGNEDVLKKCVEFSKRNIVSMVNDLR